MKVNKGLLHFEKHPKEVGTKVWRRFVRTVLQPFHRAEMDKLNENDREDVNHVISVFGGSIVPDQTRKKASLGYLKEALGMGRQRKVK